MKIAVLGPITPFRGGIARHTTALARALAARSDTTLETLSFSRLYPRRLYPGESDRDPEAQPPQDLAPRFVLDTLSPLSWQRTTRALLQAQPEVAVLPAWTFFVAPALGTVARRLARRGVRIVTVAHNAGDHESARWKSAALRYQLGASHQIITHNAPLARALEALAPGVPVSISPHPLYDDYPTPCGLLPRRAPLELLMFGLVRPYKGLDVLLSALARVPAGRVHLSVVGEFWTDLRQTEARLAALGIADRVEIVARYVSDAEAAEYFARADAAVLPYLSASGSGVAALAHWYGRPVVASDVAGLAEAVEPAKTGWLFPAGDAEALARLITEELSPAAHQAMAPHLARLRERLSWAGFAEHLLKAAEAAPAPPS
ncbi:MAG: glycosyltransferase [Pseudomonadota bacterium]